MPRITGNKGEWSELYVFLELLSSGKLYAADENLKKLEDIFFPILKVLREEQVDKKSEYRIADNEKVELFVNNAIVKTVSRDLISDYAKKLYSGIRSGGDRAFEIPEAEKAMKELDCEKIKAPSTDKSDITLQLFDINTGYKPICGFSIKSELGNAPTLLNAGKTTNFRFEATGMTDALMSEINAIDTKNKILDRVNKINENGELKFRKAENKTFSENLMLLDSVMEEILAESLLLNYTGKASTCKDAVELLEANNPVGYPKKGYYEYKYKKFLCAVALGMTPSKVWDGKDEANGGYIVVTTNGDVLAYHIYNRDFFEQYLLDNTKFERASTTRHQFASVYKEDGKYYFDLNLQIRFIK